MAQTIRVSLSGYNALTDTNLDHYALYSDSDNILIKEYTRGSISVSAYSTSSVAHNLGYVPSHIVLVNYFPSNPMYILTYGAGIYADFSVYANNQNLYFQNKRGNTIYFYYYIFYDNV